MRLSDARFVVGKPHCCSLDDGRNRDPNGWTGRDGGGQYTCTVYMCWQRLSSKMVVGNDEGTGSAGIIPPPQPFPTAATSKAFPRCSQKTMLHRGVLCCRGRLVYLLVGGQADEDFPGAQLARIDGIAVRYLAFLSVRGHITPFFPFFFPCPNVLPYSVHTVMFPLTQSCGCFISSFSLSCLGTCKIVSCLLARGYRQLLLCCCALVLGRWFIVTSLLAALSSCSVPVLAPSLSLSSVSFLPFPPLLPPPLLSLVSWPIATIRVVV